MANFEKSILWISARSPFARRVRLAFREHQLSYEEKVVDVFKPNPELRALNPLVRVPTLQLHTGQVLIDSCLILDAFYQANPQSALLPRGEAEYLESSRWSGIAVGLCEKTVEYYLETLRPEGQRDAELLDEVKRMVSESLIALETHLKDRLFVAGEQLTQADLDLGAALNYIALRQSDGWKVSFPRLKTYWDRLAQRESFRATEPPPAI